MPPQPDGAAPRRTLEVNGRTHAPAITPGDTLLEVLRDRLGLTGAKAACRHGECGACTVLVGGSPVMACVTLAIRVTQPVETVEGVAEEAGDLRAALADCGGFQCAFCTPGMVVRGVALLRGGLPASDAGSDWSALPPRWSRSRLGPSAISSGAHGHARLPNDAPDPRAQTSTQT